MNETNRLAPAFETITLGVEGMTCDHCAMRVKKALSSVPGVQSVTVDRSTHTAKVTSILAHANRPALEEAVRRSGYRVS